MKRFLYAVTALGLAIILCLGTGCSLLPTEEELLPIKLVSESPVEYATETVELSDMESAVIGTGYFRTYVNSSVSFGVDGTLAKKNITMNQNVKKGELIGVLKESDDYELMISEKTRAINDIKIEMQQAEAAANGEGESALLALELEEAEYALKVLTDSGVDKNSNEYKAQELRVNIAKTSYENSLSKSKTIYETVKANYELSLDELEILRKKYDNCFLYAPISGVCTYVNSVRPGSSIAANDEYASISDTSSMRLSYSSLSDISEYVDVGTEMTVTIDGSEYTGVITQTPQTQPEGVSYGVKYMYMLTVNDINMRDPAYIGVTASVKLLIDSRKDVIVLSDYILAEDSGHYYVSVYRDGLPYRVEVTLGLRNGTHSEILSGLSVGDQIIVG